MGDLFDDMEKILDDAFHSAKKTVKQTLNKIHINGETFEVGGNNIVVKNGKVIVNGEVIKDNLKDNVHIRFEGDLASLDCTTATINGNVGGDVDGTNITINGNVQGDVDGTNIKCGDIKGDVDGTTINCGNIGGDVDAMTVKRK